MKEEGAAPPPGGRGYLLSSKKFRWDFSSVPGKTGAGTTMKHPSILLKAAQAIDKKYQRDLPMLLLVGEMPFADRCPGVLRDETGEMDWWHDGLAYERLGTYNGDPMWVIEPTYWRLNDCDGLELAFTLESYDSRMVVEYFIVHIGGDAFTKCVVFPHPDDVTDSSLFDPEKFIFHEF